MRILHVSDCFPPRTGGIETQVNDLAAAQAAAGHEVHVATATAGSDGARRATRVLGSGVRVHRMASALTFGLPVNPRGRWLVGEAIERLLPDVVHVHAGVVSPFALDGVVAARAARVPLAVTWHCMLDGVVPGYGALARLTGLTRAPMAVSAVSRVAGERVGQALGRDDVLVVPNGLTVADWRPAAGAASPARPGGAASPVPRAGAETPVPPADATTPARREGAAPPVLPEDAAPPAPPEDAAAPLPPDGPLRLVATQRLAPRKRTVPLVTVVAAAHRRLGADVIGAPRLHLTVIGDGPQGTRVRARVNRLGLGDVVTLAGRVPRNVLSARYAGEHVFVAPARLEAFGIAGLEARAAGLPVVAGRGTGVSEYITDGVDGLLTADRAEGLDDGAADAALTAAIVRLAEDHDLLARFRRRAVAEPPAADWADVLAACDRLYARAVRILESPSRGGS